MVLYYDPQFAMFPAARHNPPQSFNFGQPYAYSTAPGGASVQSQPYTSSQMSPASDLGCSGLGPTIVSTDSTFQQNMTWPGVYPVSAPIPATPSSARPSSASYEDWTQPQGSPLPTSPCSHVSVSQAAVGAQPPFAYGPPLHHCPPGTDFSGPSVASHVILPDFGHHHHPDGHPSPDSALAVSSDGLSGSESPGAPVPVANPGAVPVRPQPARSPYEWMKKTSYQSQPNPGHLSKHIPAPKDCDGICCPHLNFAPGSGPPFLLPDGKTRTKDKYRVVYSDHQRLELEKEFHYSRYITIRRKSELAAMLGLSERQVKIWFQNRRAKERKQNKKREELLQKSKEHIQQTLHTAGVYKPLVGLDPDPQT